MGEDAAERQVFAGIVEADDLLRLLRQEAETAHTGVDLQMHLGHVRPFGGDLVEKLRRLPGADGHNDPQVQQAVQFSAVGDSAEHQELRVVEAVFPQNLRLADIGDAKTVDALLRQGLRQRQHPQSVAVTLDDRPNGHALCLLFQLPDILLQNIPFHHICVHALPSEMNISIGFQYQFFLRFLSI